MSVSDMSSLSILRSWVDRDGEGEGGVEHICRLLRSVKLTCREDRVIYDCRHSRQTMVCYVRVVRGLKKRVHVLPWNLRSLTLCSSFLSHTSLFSAFRSFLFQLSFCHTSPLTLRALHFHYPLQPVPFPLPSSTSAISITLFNQCHFHYPIQPVPFSLPSSTGAIFESRNLTTCTVAERPHTQIPHEYGDPKSLSEEQSRGVRVDDWVAFIMYRLVF